jgi:hypothetical protein
LAAHYSIFENKTYTNVKLKPPVELLTHHNDSVDAGTKAT